MRVCAHPYGRGEQWYRVFVHARYPGQHQVVGMWLTGHEWTHWVTTRNARLREASETAGEASDDHQGTRDHVRD